MGNSLNNKFIEKEKMLDQSVSQSVMWGWHFESDNPLTLGWFRWEYLVISLGYTYLIIHSIASLLSTFTTTNIFSVADSLNHEMQSCLVETQGSTHRKHSAPWSCSISECSQFANYWFMIKKCFTASQSLRKSMLMIRKEN